MIYIARVGSLWVCEKVEVAVLGFPALIVLTVSVDVKQHLKKYVGNHGDKDFTINHSVATSRN